MKIKKYLTALGLLGLTASTTTLAVLYTNTFKELNILKRECHDLRESLQYYKNEIKDLKFSLDYLNDYVDDLETKIDFYIEQIIQMIGEDDLDNEEILKLQKQVEELSKQVEELQELKSILENDIVKVQSELKEQAESNKIVIKELQDKLDELQKKFDAQTKDINKLEEELIFWKDNVHNLEDNIDSANRQITQLINRVTELVSQGKLKDSHIANLEHAINELQEMYDGLEESLEVATNHIIDLEKELDSLKNPEKIDISSILDDKELGSFSKNPNEEMLLGRIHTLFPELDIREIEVYRIDIDGYNGTALILVKKDSSIYINDALVSFSIDEVKKLKPLSEDLTKTSLPGVLALTNSAVLEAVTKANPRLEFWEITIQNIRNILVGGEADVVVNDNSQIYEQGSIHITFRLL